MHRYPNLRIYWTDMRSRAALELALTAAAPEPYRRRARKDAQSLVKEPYPHGPAMGTTILAALAGQEGDTGRAVTLLTEALRLYQEAGMLSSAAAAKLRLASLCGGERGAALRTEAESWAAQEGVRDLETVKRLHTSGFRN